MDLIEVDWQTNPLGLKGRARSAPSGSPPAVINALVDALGGRAVDMPATPETVRRALRPGYEAGACQGR